MSFFHSKFYQNFQKTTKMKYIIVLLVLFSALFFACDGNKGRSKNVDCVAEYNKKYAKAVERYTKKYESIIKKNPKNASSIISELHIDLHKTIGKLQKELNKCQKRRKKY